MQFHAGLLYALCAASLTRALPHAVSDGKYTRLVVFGDSFSDNGNGAWVASDHKWPVDPAYYHHSFSNGPKWNEVVSEDLGLELLILATGGATTDNAYIAGFTGADSKIPVPSAADQIATFLKTTDGPRKHDVFVQWIGANDILFDNTANPEKVAQLIKANIDLLREHGARTVLLANYYDINTAPATYNSEYYSTANAKSFNAELTTQLKMLARRYSCSTFKVRFVDISEIFHSLETDPAKFGFDEKYLNPPTACLTGVYTSEGVPRNLCSDPEKHVFFDGYHVGKEVHALIGQKFEDAILAA